MCISPIGIGAAQAQPIQNTQVQDTQETQATEELRCKHLELCDLQAKMLAAPRKARASFKSEVNLLEDEIHRLQTSALSQDLEPNMDLESTIQSLRSSMDDRDSQMIVIHVKDLVKAVNRTGKHGTESADCDETALLHLIDVCPSIIEAMCEHSHLSGVIAAGCEAFCSLFLGVETLLNGDDIHARLQNSRHASLGHVVVAGMKAHPMDRDVQFFACQILARIAENMSGSSQCDDDNYVWVVGARIAVGKARRNHPEDREVTKWADKVIQTRFLRSDL